MPGVNNCLEMLFVTILTSHLRSGMTQVHSTIVSRLVVIIFAVIVTIVLISNFRPPHSARHQVSVSENAWHYDFSRDANSHTLSDSQCTAAFPRLFDNIDKAVKTRVRDEDWVLQKDLVIPAGRCMLRVMIFEGEVR